jgi:hypothetical protein
MDYNALVTEQEKERTALDKRMQGDSDLYYLAPYVMSDLKGRPVPDIVNLTLNRVKVYADLVIDTLQGTTQQTVVEADSESFDTHTVEEFQDMAFKMADVKLREDRKPGLNTYADVQLCLRGRTARRVLFRWEEDKLVTDILPWDGRWVYYEDGKDGYRAYKTTRSKSQIEKDYGVIVKGQTGKVLDVWTPDHNEVWIDTIKELEQEHSYGFIPVVLEIVPSGYGQIIQDVGWQVHEGESIFHKIRTIVPALNQLVSILQTLNVKSVKPPMKQTRKGGGTPSDYEDVTDSGAITAMDVGEDVAPIDYGDVKRSAEMLYGIIEKAMQEGSIDTTALGNLQFPLSAVALVEMGERQGHILIPITNCKAELNQATAKMFTQQTLQIGGSIELGTPGHKRTFNTRKLEGEYETTYKYFVKSPKTDIARMSVAQAAKEWYPRKYIYSDVLQLEDPEGTEREWYAELAEKVDPNVLKYRIIMELLEHAEEDGDEDAAREAQIMAVGMGITLEQARQGIMAPPMPEASSAEVTSEPIVPLLGKGATGTGGQPSSNQMAGLLSKTPQEAKNA